MNTTINISLPKAMYKDAKKVLPIRGYASISELIRHALREILYPKLTENGFTREFEYAVLKSEKEPIENDIVLETEKDIHDYFINLKVPPKIKMANAKNPTMGKVQSSVFASNKG